MVHACVLAYSSCFVTVLAAMATRSRVSPSRAELRQYSLRAPTTTYYRETTKLETIGLPKSVPLPGTHMLTLTLRPCACICS